MNMIKKGLCALALGATLFASQTKAENLPDKYFGMCQAKIQKYIQDKNLSVEVEGIGIPADVRITIDDKFETNLGNPVYLAPKLTVIPS